MEKKMQLLFTWVVGPTVVGFVGQLVGGWTWSLVGSIIGIFVGWWAGRRYFPS
jgi:hypothetical protein